jgi:hypothetical protein
LCELAGRARRQTKSSFIEWAIQQALRTFDSKEELRAQEAVLEEIARRFSRLRSHCDPKAADIGNPITDEELKT